MKKPKKDANVTKVKTSRSKPEPKRSLLETLIEGFDLSADWIDTKVVQLTYGEFVSTPAPKGQRKILLTEEAYQSFLQTLMGRQSLATVTLAETPDGKRHLIDGQHRQGALLRCYNQVSDTIKRYLESRFLQPAEILKVNNLDEAMELFLVRNRNRRALTQAEYNQVGFYPLIQGYTEFLDGMRSTSFWRVMESTMTEEEILQLEPERLLEHVFAVTVKNRKSDSEAFRRSLTKGKYDDSVYSRLRQSCLDVAGLIGDVEIPSGTGRNAREYQIAARKILLNGSAMLARARINGGGRNWQEPMKKIVATVLDATVAPNVRKEHLKSTWKSFNGVPSGGGKHQKDLRVIFQKAVQGGK